jgi:hypothetical protein
MIWFESRDLDFFVLLLFSSLFFCSAQMDGQRSYHTRISCMHAQGVRGRSIAFFSCFLSLLSCHNRPGTSRWRNVNGGMERNALHLHGSHDIFCLEATGNIFRHQLAR